MKVFFLLLFFQQLFAYELLYFKDSYDKQIIKGNPAKKYGLEMIKDSPETIDRRYLEHYYYHTHYDNSVRCVNITIYPLSYETINYVWNYDYQNENRENYLPSKMFFKFMRRSFSFYQNNQLVINFAKYEDFKMPSKKFYENDSINIEDGYYIIKGKIKYTCEYCIDGEMVQYNEGADINAKFSTDFKKLVINFTSIDTSKMGTQTNNFAITLFDTPYLTNFGEYQIKLEINSYTQYYVLDNRDIYFWNTKMYYNPYLNRRYAWESQGPIHCSKESNIAIDVSDIKNFWKQFPFKSSKYILRFHFPMYNSHINKSLFNESEFLDNEYACQIYSTKTGIDITSCNRCQSCSFDQNKTILTVTDINDFFDEKYMDYPFYISKVLAPPYPFLLNNFWVEIFDTEANNYLVKLINHFNDTNHDEIYRGFPAIENYLECDYIQGGFIYGTPETIFFGGENDTLVLYFEVDDYLSGDFNILIDIDKEIYCHENSEINFLVQNLTGGNFYTKKLDYNIVNRTSLISYNITNVHFDYFFDSAQFTITNCYFPRTINVYGLNMTFYKIIRSSYHKKEFSNFEYGKFPLNYNTEENNLHIFNYSKGDFVRGDNQIYFQEYPVFTIHDKTDSYIHVANYQILNSDFFLTDYRNGMNSSLTCKIFLHFLHFKNFDNDSLIITLPDELNIIDYDKKVNKGGFKCSEKSNRETCYYYENNVIEVKHALDENVSGNTINLTIDGLKNDDFAEKAQKVVDIELKNLKHERIGYYYNPAYIAKIKFEKREILYDLNIDSKSSSINNDESVYVLKLNMYNYIKTNQLVKMVFNKNISLNIDNFNIKIFYDNLDNEVTDNINFNYLYDDYLYINITNFDSSFVCTDFQNHSIYIKIFGLINNRKISNNFLNATFFSATDTLLKIPLTSFNLTFMNENMALLNNVNTELSTYITSDKNIYTFNFISKCNLEQGDIISFKTSWLNEVFIYRLENDYNKNEEVSFKIFIKNPFSLKQNYFYIHNFNMYSSLNENIQYYNEKIYINLQSPHLSNSFLVSNNIVSLNNLRTLSSNNLYTINFLFDFLPNNYIESNDIILIEFLDVNEDIKIDSCDIEPKSNFKSTANCIKINEKLFKITDAFNDKLFSDSRIQFYFKNVKIERSSFKLYQNLNIKLIIADNEGNYKEKNEIYSLIKFNNLCSNNEKYIDLQTKECTDNIIIYKNKEENKEEKEEEEKEKEEEEEKNNKVYIYKEIEKIVYKKFYIKTNLKRKIKYKNPFDYYLIPISLLIIIFIIILLHKLHLKIFRKIQLYYNHYNFLISTLNIYYKILVITTLAYIYKTGEKIFYFYSIIFLLHQILNFVYIILKNLTMKYNDKIKLKFIIKNIVYVIDYKFCWILKEIFEEIYNNKNVEFNNDIFYKLFYIIIEIDIILVQLLNIVICVFSMIFYQTFSTYFYLSFYSLFISLLIFYYLSKIIFDCKKIKYQKSIYLVKKTDEGIVTKGNEIRYKMNANGILTKSYTCETEIKRKLDNNFFNTETTEPNNPINVKTLENNNCYINKTANNNYQNNNTIINENDGIMIINKNINSTGKKLYSYYGGSYEVATTNNIEITNCGKESKFINHKIDEISEFTINENYNKTINDDDYYIIAQNSNTERENYYKNHEKINKKDSNVNLMNDFKNKNNKMNSSVEKNNFINKEQK